MIVNFRQSINVTPQGSGRCDVRQRTCGSPWQAAARRIAWRVVRLQVVPWAVLKQRAWATAQENADEPDFRRPADDGFRSDVAARARHRRGQSRPGFSRRSGAGGRPPQGGRGGGRRLEPVPAHARPAGAAPGRGQALRPLARFAFDPDSEIMVTSGATRRSPARFAIVERATGWCYSSLCTTPICRWCCAGGATNVAPRAAFPPDRGRAGAAFSPPQSRRDRQPAQSAASSCRRRIWPAGLLHRLTPSPSR